MNDFADDAQVSRVLNAHSGTDRSAKRHHGGGAGIDQLAGVDQIVVSVRQYDEAFLDQNAGGFEQSFIVWEQRLLIADHFELDPVGEADFAGEAGGADRFVGGVAAGGVGQDEHFRTIDVIDQGFFGFVGEIDAADGDGDHFGARSG